jgi:hypothetical protein
VRARSLPMPGAWNALQYAVFVIFAIPYYAVMAPLLLLSHCGMRLVDAAGRCCNKSGALPMPAADALWLQDAPTNRTIIGVRVRGCMSVCVYLCAMT